MASTASARRSGRRRSAAPALPDDLVVWEILVRLPAKELLRCRAWYQLASADDFLLAHHRRQPSLPLVSFHGLVSRGSGDVTDAAIDAFDIRQTPAVRRPVLAFNDYNHRRNFTIHASCDGLILLSLANNRFYICNPATRHWAALPSLTGTNVAALYPHRPSGEYRILYWKGDCNAICYYILTVGSSEQPRCIGLPLELASMKPVMIWGPPVLLHDCLHWVSGCTTRSKIIVFDTVVETFRWMHSPTSTDCASLLEMDGTLGISRVNDSSRTTKARVWVLQDCKMEVWSLKYQIELPAAEMMRITENKYFYGSVVSEKGDMLVTCRHPWYMFHCDRNGSLLEKYLCDGIFPTAIGHNFKESLVRHPFFQRRHGSHVRQPRFFRGL